MLKRTVAIGISVLTLMLAIASQAAGGTISGTSVSSCLCYQNDPKLPGADIVSPTNGTCPSGYTKKCSIDLLGALANLGNLTKAKCLSTDPALPPECSAIHKATLFIEEGAFGCFNPANNSFDAKGVPFIQADLAGLDVAQSFEIANNGSAGTEIRFLNPQILETQIECGAFVGDDTVLCPFDVKKKPRSTCPTGYYDLENEYCRPQDTSVLDTLCKPKWNALLVTAELEAFGELFTKYAAMSTCDPNDPVHDGVAADPTTGCTNTLIDGFATGLADGHCHLLTRQGSCDYLGGGFAKIGNLCYSACARPDAMDLQCSKPANTPAEGFEYACTTLCKDEPISPTTTETITVCPTGYTLQADNLCHFDGPGCPLVPARITP